jgi:hypothetical protein
MRERWFGDNRDLVKWGVLAHLAGDYGLRTIVHVPYERTETDRPSFIFRGKRLTVADLVWKFFRDMRRIEMLGRQIEVEVKIINEEFRPSLRRRYAACISNLLVECERPLLLFLDPDTGIEPKAAAPEHITEYEIRRAWTELKAGDWLVLYQHARRVADWVDSACEQLSRICGGENVEVARSERVGRDVAFLCVLKPPDA